MKNTNNENNITDKHKWFLNEYSLSVNEENKCLRHIHLFRKLHKNPAKGRFIIEPPKCSMKLPSKFTTAAFKVLFQHTDNDQT